MPIVIKELTVDVVVENNQSGPPAANTGANSGDKEKIVKECVEQVLTILREKEER